MNLRHFVFPEKYPFGADKWYYCWSRYLPNATLIPCFTVGEHTSDQCVFEYFQKFVVEEQVNKHPKDDIQTDDG